MDKILAITGATGKKSGGGTVKLLSDHKEDIMNKFPGGIRALVRSTSNTTLLDHSEINFDIYRGDFNDEAFLDAALEGVDTVLHIAGIHLSEKLVDASVRCGVRRLIFVHTTGIYSKYKQAGEEYRQIDTYIEKQCKKNHIKLTLLRPTMIYGNITDQNVVKFIKMVDKLPLMPVVNGARYDLQPVHYMDLANAYYQVLMNESTEDHNYVLSGETPISLRNMLIEIGRCLDKKVHFINCPFPIAYAGAWGLYLLTIKHVDYREKVQRLCEPRVYSHEEASRDFGYNPRTFQLGIVNEVKEYENSKRKKK